MANRSAEYSVDMDVGAGGKFSPKLWTLQCLKAIVQKWQTSMQAVNGWNALFLENHDQSRSVSRFTPHRPEHRTLAAKMLAIFLALQSGTLFIYQGQELGMRNLPRDWSIEEYRDVETQNLYKECVALGIPWLSTPFGDWALGDMTLTSYPGRFQNWQAMKQDCVSFSIKLV